MSVKSIGGFYWWEKVKEGLRRKRHSSTDVKRPGHFKTYHDDTNSRTVMQFRKGIRKQGMTTAN